MVLSGLEDRGNAFNWLEKVWQMGESPTTSIKVDMVWDPVTIRERHAAEQRLTATLSQCARRASLETDRVRRLLNPETSCPGCVLAVEHAP